MSNNEKKNSRLYMVCQDRKKTGRIAEENRKNHFENSSEPEELGRKPEEWPEENRKKPEENRKNVEENRKNLARFRASGNARHWRASELARVNFPYAHS